MAWIPLRQLPGLGTVSNVVVIGLAVDATLAVLPAPSALAARVGFVVAGVLLNAVSHFEGRHAELVLVCSSELILRPFQLTGVTDLLNIVESREQALGCLA